MKILQNILIAIVAVLILAGLYTNGWASVGFSAGAAVVAFFSILFVEKNNKNKK